MPVGDFVGTKSTINLLEKLKAEEAPFEDLGASQEGKGGARGKLQSIYSAHPPGKSIKVLYLY